MPPRIYNLFPTLVGPVTQWSRHLERIAAMNFDWIYVNPFVRTGGSGSLYAIADPNRLSDASRGNDERDDDEIVQTFVRDAERHGVRVMMDLVVNHCARDAPVVADHPDWFRRDESGAVAAPFAVDPDDPNLVTVWGDLAEFDYAPRPARAALVAYASGIATTAARLGIRGFRCDAAYKIPADVWAEIAAGVRAVAPDAVFVAETLGCTREQLAALERARFDYFFNSVKWWDLAAPWALEQYDRDRTIAPSIAFPESHDTPRLVADLAEPDDDAVRREYVLRYLVAATFSAGVMMPIGYEFGFAKALHVVSTTPEDAERPRFDLSGIIGAVNAMKAATPALGDDVPMRREPLAGGAFALVRDGGTAGDVAVAINPSETAAVTVPVADLAALLAGEPREISPRNGGDSPDGIELPPRTARVFASPARRPLEDARFADPALARPIAVEAIEPQIDGGRFPIKRVAGDVVALSATILRDGHDEIAAIVRLRHRDGAPARETPLRPLGNDRFGGTFSVDRIGRSDYEIVAWPDDFATWQHDTERKVGAAQPVALELVEGRALAEAARERSDGTPRARLDALLAALDGAADPDESAALLLSAEASQAVAAAPDRSLATVSAPLGIEVDRPAAAFAAWYEFFPRSEGATPGAHGTFATAARRLPAIRDMGFDVVYLPPVHPIGHAFRKGPNNTLTPGPADPGSPWAIGNEHGGHTAVAPELGTLEDFDAFVTAAAANGLEVAIDYALQCSPDHPYVKAHPEWFTVRPDGSIKYAENPPKKYQDIVNFNWFGPHATALWNELRDVVEFWIGHGVRTFRVDNPHTKPFAFWEWMIADVRSRHPEAIFLAEAFTRPAVMAELAKLGFSQSYTYFTWRNTKIELEEYATQLATTELAEFYRPNFFANTPDILPPYLQTGGRAAFRIRLVLAATLASLYGIYSGFELAENAGLPGREEYLDSEKFQLRPRDYDVADSLAPEIAAINAIRRANPPLRDWRNVTFHRADDDAVVFYGKRTGDDVVLVAVNLDPFGSRETTLWFPTGELGLADDEPFGVRELLSNGPEQTWRGSPHGVRLDPARNPAVIYRLTLPRRAAVV